MQQTLPKLDIVLLGIGHTIAHVLRMWRMKPFPNARLTCVSNMPVVSYSGMLPGTLAGQYPTERMQIDLVRLCAANGARLIVDEVTGLDFPNRRLLFESRSPLAFDALSIGIGSRPRTDGVTINSDAYVPIKPMQTFLTRLEQRLTQLPEKQSTDPLQVTIVGGGAGGVEIAFCLPVFLRKALGDVPFEITLVDSNDRLVNGMTEKTAAKVQSELEARGVRIRLGRRVKSLTNGKLELDNDEKLATDLVLWATGAIAPPLLAKLGLPTDDRGFLLTHPTLQTTANAPIFVVGDSGTIETDPTPKAGVYAVRQGMYLWKNLRRTLENKPLIPYKPQRGFLKLLNTGDGKAIADYLGMTFHSKLAWWLKDGIDSKFMDKYQDYRPMEMKPEKPKPDENVMRCMGCGGKVAGSVLSKALSELDVPKADHVLLGLDHPDDAAVIKTTGRPMSVTVDFFAAPFDDPYLVGRIAALNSLSDIFAMGAKPNVALAMATVPVGRPRQQESMLRDVLAGSLEEFRKTNTALVGGHTIEGPQLTIGFTILADHGDDTITTKGKLRAGDRLILTKPLGTGVLLAAHMQALCRAEWWMTLLESMLTSNQEAASLVGEFPLTGITDVTGFGLAGHLLEMLHASNVGAELHLDQIPLLPGVEELISEHKIESTLAPANRDAETEMSSAGIAESDARYAALFDPQTSGGLLLGVPESHVEEILKRLKEIGSVASSVMGEVVAREASGRRLQIRR